MPMAGAIVWLLVAMISTQVGERVGILILLFSSGAIFPIALLIARFRGETLVATNNPVAKLMGYSWIVQHPVGIIHAILRTILVVAVWYIFPEQRLFAVGLVIVLVYCISIWQLLSMPLIKHITSHAKPTPESGAA